MCRFDPIMVNGETETKMSVSTLWRGKFWNHWPTFHTKRKKAKYYRGAIDSQRHLLVQHKTNAPKRRDPPFVSEPLVSSKKEDTLAQR